jgi:hypothetical protein
LAGRINLAAAGFQFLGHAVEGVHQITDFIGGADFHAIVEPPARNLLRCFGQSDHGTRNQLREK